jgi:FAS-associated factor 2
MTILSRHAGLAATTTDKLLSHLEDQLLPRITPFLDRSRNEERRREGERRMREEQDRAYREAMNRDKDRIERKIREEEEQKRKVEEERIAQERRIMAEREERDRLRKWEERRMSWRRYMRKLIKEKSGGVTGRRIGIRLPDGRRLIHLFNEEDSLTSLYAFVDTHLIPENIPPSGDPSLPPLSLSSTSTALQGEPALHHEISNHTNDPQNWWGFQLALPYPRKEVRWREDVKIRDVVGLESGSQLVVDMVSNGKGNDKLMRNSENYDTESDEE